MTRVVEFRSSEQPHMSVSESLYYRLAEPLLFRDLDGVLGDIAAACCRRCGEVTLRADEVANHLCISGERTARLVERGMDAFRAIVDRKDLEAALAAAEARAAAAEQQLAVSTRAEDALLQSAEAYRLVEEVNLLRARAEAADQERNAERARADAAVTALVKYGGHTGNCYWGGPRGNDNAHNPGYHCECGLDAILAAAQQGTGQADEGTV